MQSKQPAGEHEQTKIRTCPLADQHKSDLHYQQINELARSIEGQLGLDPQRILDHGVVDQLWPLLCFVVMLLDSCFFKTH
jgi:hypothetical protein